MKIAVVLPDLSKNGPIIYTKYLIEGLLANNCFIDVFCFNNSNFVDLKGVNIYKISMFSFIDFSNYDIVHTHTIKADFFGFINYFSIKNKWIITLHNLYRSDLGLLYNPIKSRFIIFIWRFIFRFSKHFVVFSNHMKNYYKKELGEKDFFIVLTGVPQKKEISSEIIESKIIDSIKSKYTILGSSGHLIKRKGFSQLIWLLKLLPNYALIITGEGPEKEALLDLAEKLNVKDRFFLLGFKNNPRDYYVFYDIFVLPSYSEGLPLAMLEAFESGLPVVSSKLKNYEGILNDDDVSFFNLDDINSLVSAVIKTSNNLSYYKGKSIANYHDKFSIDVMAKEYIKVYQYVKSK